MSRKVLVVDDEKLIVKGIRFSLEQDGMEVDLSLIHILFNILQNMFCKLFPNDIRKLYRTTTYCS